MRIRDASVLRAGSVLAVIPAVLAAAPAAADAVPLGSAVYVEDSPTAVQQLLRAEELAAAGRLQDAAAALDRAVENHGGDLVPAGGDPAEFGDASRRFVEVRSRVAERLAADPPLAAAYRVAFGDEAQRLADRAGRPADPADRRTALGEVALRYGATAAGRTAALDAAGYALEAADPADARRWLAVAGSVAGEEAGDAGRGAELHAAADAVEAAARAAAAAAAAAGSDAASAPLAAGGAEPGLGAAWTFWFGPLGVEPGVDQSRRLGSGRRAASPPLVAARGSAVFLNTGALLLRLDRDAGRPVWSVDPRGVPVPPVAGAAEGGRGVLLRGDAAIAVLGESPDPRQRRFGLVEPGREPTRLVAVDARTGAARWSVTPEALDPSLARAALAGTPIGDPADAAGQPLVVLLRRAGRAGFVDTRVAGVDPATGALRWTRPLSSVSSDARFGNPDEPAPVGVAAGGRVYVDAGLGVTAALDPRTGRIAWLRVDEPDPGAAGRGTRSRAPVAGPFAPILTGAGLIVGLPDGGHALLDPGSGRRLAMPGPLGVSHDRAELQAVRDCGRLVGLVATAGGEAVALDPDTLAERWRVPAGEALPRPDGEARPAGPEVVLVAGRDAFRRRLSDGALLAREPGGAGFARVRLPGGGWIQASPAAVRLHDRPGAAAERLAARVAASPEDPSAGLALAWLGLERADPAWLLAGTDAALDAAAAAGGQEAGPVAAELLERVATAGADRAFDGVRREVLSRIAASGAADPIALAMVSSEAARSEGRLADAVALLQEVIDDPGLADRLFVLRGTTRRAGLEARERLAGLLAEGRERGIDLYATQRDRADAAFVAAREADDAAALSEVARRFPFSAAAAGALAAAAEKAGGAADPAGVRATRSLWRSAYRAALAASESGDAAADQVAARAAAALVAGEAAAGRPAAARGWARRFRRELPGVALPLRGLETATASAADPVEAWIDAAAAGGGDAADGLPRLPGVWTVRGRRPGALVPALPAAAADAGAARLGAAFGEADPAATPAGRAGGSRVVVTGGDAAAAWSVLVPAAGGRTERGFDFPPPPGDAVLLLDDGDLLLLFSAASGTLHRVRPPGGSGGAFAAGDAGTLELFDPGPLLASVPEAAAEPAAAAGTVGGVAQRIEAEGRRDRAQQEAIRRLRENRAARVGDRLGPRVLVNGRVLANGRAVDDGTVAVRGERLAAATPGVVVVAGADGRVVAADPGTGRVQWARRVPVASLDGLYLDEENLVLRGMDAPGAESAAHRLLRLDPLTGETLAPDVVEASQRPLGVAVGGGRLVVAFERFVAAYGLPGGGLLWRAPIAEDEAAGFSGRLIAGDDVVVAGTAAGGVTLCVYDAATGEPRARPLVPEPGRGALPPGGALLLGDRLDLPGGRAVDARGRRLFETPGVDAAPARVDVSATEVLVASADGGGAAVLRLDRETGRMSGRFDLPEPPGGRSAGVPLLRLVQRLLVAEDAAGLLVVDAEPAD
ncbi:outer membrane protein assembly factor BamB family protein [Phycisphaera mikurensis]|uniref:Pyrrolo-quinoline quinone repeat domain-containing protein n=1 Tax=Phycisphaera mikurensis (strain NBRC 102666 / KCTC 22515 / FYK2301M01) TaxID=1142394 RepID=I0IBB3_PHYMF|nr:PQQ-binding-like beta-propeller repeat protein [Phycisphaera mikurensis]MBB6443046.1 outer membrane protein assembly factor BamB [Phycisphaera mikurensis]BAM02551.1 hypothetical protein PSMK_03920 [Phycisphaera mikurensis NBRC 102666]